jgi:hypothetical protein
MTATGLRPATGAGSEFCYRLHGAAMGQYVTAIWGRDEQVQRDLHARAFRPGAWQIITAGGADMGMLHVEYRPGEAIWPASRSIRATRARASEPG